MAEKKFYLESTRPLQEIGMRVQIVSFLISQGIDRGNVLNDKENANKVIVAISTDEEKEIIETRDSLVEHLNNLHKNKLCYPDFPKDIHASELKELNNPTHVTILNFDKLSNSLMLEQTGKGVGAMKSLGTGLDNLSIALTKAFGILERIEGKGDSHKKE